MGGLAGQERQHGKAGEAGKPVFTDVLELRGQPAAKPPHVILCGISVSSQSKASRTGRFCALPPSCPKKREGDIGGLWGPEQRQEGAGTARPGTGVLSKEGPRGGTGLRHSTAAKIKDSSEDAWVQVPRPPFASCVSRGGFVSLSFLICSAGPYLSRSAGFKAVELGRRSGERCPRAAPSPS